MNIIVPVKMVPDLIEELSLDETGTALDKTWLRFIINEYDDHAIEEAILLKERQGGNISIVSLDNEGVDDVLYTAAAKGVDRLIKVIGDFEGGVNNHTLGRMLASVLREIQPDLILTGVQANDDLDGSVGPLLAEYMGFPYIGYVTGVNIENGKAKIIKEYPGGLIAEMEVRLPTVLGIQAAEQPPRYVAVSKVRQVMRTANIEERPATQLDSSGAPLITRLYQPETSEYATMLSDDPDQASVQMVTILKDMDLL